MLAPYARDASLLFLEHAQAPTLRCAQPVCYHNVAMRVAMGRIQTGETPHAVHVDWWGGTVMVYESVADRINGTPSSRIIDALPRVQEEHADVYVKEAFAFLLRGHSLRTPGCTCAPTFAHRATALGISPYASTKCLLDASGEWPTLEEFAHELAVQDLRGTVEVMRSAQRGVARLPLLTVLVQLAGMRTISTHEDGRLRLGTPECCVPRVIESAEDVARGAELLSPRPFLYDPSRLDLLTQNEIARGLAAMQRALQLRVLESDTEGVMAVFCNRRWLMLEPHAHARSVMQRHWAEIPPVAPPKVLIAQVEPTLKKTHSKRRAAVKRRAPFQLLRH